MKKDIMISVIFLLLLMGLIVLINMNITGSLDMLVYDFIHNVFNGSFMNVFKVITFVASTKFMIGFGVVLAILWRRKGRGLMISLTLLSATLLAHLVKIIIQRPRPLYMDANIAYESTFSFPSGHTCAITTVIGMFIYFLVKSELSKKIKVLLSTLCIIVALLVMVSRIYLQVHYFTDVLGGILVALFSVSIFNLLYKRIIKSPTD